jgi:hypothetical protein
MPAESSLAFNFDQPPAISSTTSASAAGSKPTTRRKRIETGWCEAGNHEKCPHMMRAHRVTPKGKELRELWCSCRCHKKSAPGR